MRGGRVNREGGWSLEERAAVTERKGRTLQCDQADGVKLGRNGGNLWGVTPRYHQPGPTMRSRDSAVSSRFFVSELPQHRERHCGGLPDRAVSLCKEVHKIYQILG